MLLLYVQYRLLAAALLPTPSWEQLVRTHASRVFAYAYHLTGNRADAEDLMQDAFVRAFRALATEAPRNPGGWLRRITRNLYLDRVRHQPRHQTVGLPDQIVQVLVDVRPHPGEELDRRALDWDVQAAMDGLSDLTRTAVLCDLYGFSYEEIAAVLGVGYGTVRSRIHRGRRNLRSALRHRAPGCPPRTTPVWSRAERS